MKMQHKVPLSYELIEYVLIRAYIYITYLWIN